MSVKVTDDMIQKGIKHEIEFMRYYAVKEDRLKLTEDSDLYNTLNVIGYTKVKLSLAARCAYFIIDVNDMTVCTGPRNKEKNHLTPLEYYWNLNKQNRNDIISKLL